MRLFIQSEHADGDVKATGPLHSIPEAERMMDRIAKVKDVVAAKCWNTNDKGEAVGAPLMSYAKG